VPLKVKRGTLSAKASVSSTKAALVVVVVVVMAVGVAVVMAAAMAVAKVSFLPTVGLLQLAVPRAAAWDPGAAVWRSWSGG
jgi:hypothetical protein